MLVVELNSIAPSVNTAANARATASPINLARGVRECAVGGGLTGMSLTFG